MIDTTPVREAGTSRGTRPSFVKLGLFLLVLALLAGATVVWGIRARVSEAAGVRQKTLEQAVPVVAVIHPKPGEGTNEIVLPGNVQAFTDAPIYARASGYLKKWYVDIGASVKSGQVLADIDAPEIDQQVQEARASLQQGQAALDQALANQQQGKANEQLARVTATRWSNLAAKGVVSRQENDQYQAQYQAQTANVQALEKAVSVGRANLASAQANLGRLEELQRYKTVRAPFDGVVTARNTDVGALINAGGSGQELFHMAAISKLRVFVSVPQVYSRAAVPGIVAQLTLPEFPGRSFRGTLVRTAGAIDPATRTLLTEINVDNASGELRPGAYAQVHLALRGGARSLILPVNALLFRSEGLQAGVVREGGKVELVPVVIGKDFGNEVEVVSGITADDAVIVNPPDSLTAGAIVRTVSGTNP